MHYDLGLQGLGILLAISALFGAGAQLVFWRSAPRWLFLVAAAAWFVGGLIASEVIWGTLTEQDIQPIIDGLAFDESLLGGLILGLVATLPTWFVTRRKRTGQPA